MKEMLPFEDGVTLLSDSRHAEAEPAPGLVWLCSVSVNPASAHVRALMAGISKGGLGRWQVFEPPAGQPAAIALLEGRLRSALLVLLVDTPSLAAGRVQTAFQTLALLGNQPLVVLLDRLPGPSSTREEVGATKARIRQLAAQHDLDEVEVVTVDPGGGLPSMDAGIIRLSSALLHMAGLRAADVPGPLRMQVLTSSPGTDPSVHGELLQGSVAAGDCVRLLPSGQIAQVRGLVGLGNRMPRCSERLTLHLAEPANVGGVELVTAADEPVELADEFMVHLVGDTSDAITGHCDWQVRLGTARRLRHARLLDLRPLPADEGGAPCFAGRLCLDAAVPFASAPALLPLRLFSLHAGVDTPAAAAGMLLRPNRAAAHIHRQAVSVDKAMRARHMGQQPCVVWLTGLSGAGKSTIANLVEQRLLARGLHTYLLDGDNVRHGLNRDLGFTDQDRVENIRRVAEVAKLMVDAGLIVITAFISPFRAERELARRLMAHGEFLEIHVDAPLALAEQRDVKGLYRKARRGEIKGFTGIDAPYEPPDEPELRIDTSQGTAEDAADTVLRLLQARGIINATASACR